MRGPRPYGRGRERGKGERSDATRPGSGRAVPALPNLGEPRHLAAIPLSVRILPPRTRLHGPMLLVLAALDLAGLALGAWLLFARRAQRRPSARRDLAVLSGLGLALGLGTGLLGLEQGEPFLILRLWCHVLFCILAPLAILLGLVRRDLPGLAGLLLGLAAVGAYAWARRVEPFWLEVTRHRITSERLPARDAPLRIVVLADLQTDEIGAFEGEVFAAIRRERPDLVLVPGDLLQLQHAWSSPAAVARERAALAELFASLQPPPRLGIVMVGGDCEPPGVGLPEAGLYLLEDEVLVLAEEGLQILGLTRPSSRRPLRGELVERARGFEGLTIVLGHAPDFALSVPELELPLLCVAGHTHGGQVQLPWIGPLVTLSRVPRAVAAGGLFPLGPGWLCVSRGIGMERGHAPRIRFLCRPELVVLELDSAEGSAGAGPP